MSGLTASVIGLAAFGPCLAPVPAQAPPDPTGKGYLGIWFTAQGGNPLGVDRLEPGAPASRVGIRPGDVIVRVNSFKPQSTQAMIDYVMSCRPGAAVEVEVQRGVDRKTFRIVLAAKPPPRDLSYPAPFDPGFPLERP
ncbi:MAG: PDZ domain-containing protein [Gemmataceae bacterium]|nr:PDZ domain-containing protein [Gemmataceae bacterium]